MLGDKTAVATIAVKDMDAAKKYYTEKLGLKETGRDDPGGIMLKSGDSNVFIYYSTFAGTNQATACSWGVGDDLEAIVKDLEGKGIKFEEYDNLPVEGFKREGAIHTVGKIKAAWFKDPDGNILNLVNQM